MFNTSAKSILAALTLVAGASFSVPASAEWAGYIESYSGPVHGSAQVGSSYIQEPKKHVGNRYQKHRKHNRHYNKHVGHRGHCGPRRALRKAWNLGLNRPHVARINKRKIVVVGYNYGHAAKVVFKRNSQRCKVIKTSGLY